MGTPEYMAPEQAMSARDVTPAADVWSLGVVAYELFSGVAPFDAAREPAVLYKIIHEEPAPLRARNRTVPADVAAASACSSVSTGRPVRPAASLSFGVT